MLNSINLEWKCKYHDTGPKHIYILICKNGIRKKHALFYYTFFIR